MTFSVYSLGVSNTMPTQSQYLPMVNLYFMLGITYTFLAYIWFILCNDFQSKNYLPKFLEIVATKFVKKILFWKFEHKPVAKVEQMKVEEVKSDLKDSENSNKSSKNKTNNTSLNTQINLSTAKCQACNLCENCLKEKEKEKEKKKQKDLNESNISALNYIMCFFMIMVQIISNLIVWLLVSNPPSSY